MKALLSRQAGGPETLTLEDVADPAPGPGQVLIAMRACGLNFPDALLIRDLYQLRPPRPFSPGGEVAGIVVDVGREVTHVRAGDRVLAMPGLGGLATRVVADAAMCVKIPAAMSFEHGAALLVTYGTVHYGLSRRARIRAGESLLVLGAGGGIGLAAVELGRACGARVIAAASTQAKVDAALARGASTGFVYPTGEAAGDGRQLAQLFKLHCGAQGVDVVCDPVGGVYAEAALRSMAWGGRYLVIGFAAGDIPRIPLNLPLLKGCDIQGVLYGAHAQRDPAAVKVEIGELLALYAEGAIQPHISARFPLSQGGAAIAAIASRQALGKLVVVNEE
ncbi:MAG: NADPH:quinone oxidoreductase family protein [Gammaproteobacteria bacterium]|nr:NADPH:quinone oxidoreductase family protein [Gammaproteobacteria bacterium]MDH4310391.1 NADPH:quinone oxidoreductase family protein [Gammaproteobacteria bacterium]MDH5273508.1 NADPH:quinone oxidoreductase family protein [Gammaproteobacteria bacterium]